MRKSRAARAAPPPAPSPRQSPLRPNLPVLSDPVLCAEIEAMAHRVVGDRRLHASPRGDLLDTLGLARPIAQAQIDLMRVRRARHDLVSSRFADPGYRTSKGPTTAIAMLSEAGKTLARGEPIPPAMAHDILHRPQGAAKYAVILAELCATLAAMDRYERRALSRRKFAIRAFDAACVAAAALRRRRPPGFWQNEPTAGEAVLTQELAGVVSGAAGAHTSPTASQTPLLICSGDRLWGSTN